MEKYQRFTREWEVCLSRQNLWIQDKNNNNNGTAHNLKMETILLKKIVFAQKLQTFVSMETCQEEIILDSGRIFVFLLLISACRFVWWMKDLHQYHSATTDFYNKKNFGRPFFSEAYRDENLQMYLSLPNGPRVLFH